MAVFKVKGVVCGTVRVTRTFCRIAVTRNCFVIFQECYVSYGETDVYFLFASVLLFKEHV